MQKTKQNKTTTSPTSHFSATLAWQQHDRVSNNAAVIKKTTTTQQPQPVGGFHGSGGCGAHRLCSDTRLLLAWCVYVSVCACVCRVMARPVPACVCTRECADLAGPLARLLVESLGGCQNGLIDRLVGGHQQQLGLIVILTISKLIFVIYLPLLYCLFLLRLGGAGQERRGRQWLLFGAGGARRRK